MSAPARRDSLENPCGGRPTDIEHTPRSEEEILQGIITASQKAYEGAVNIREQFASDTLDLEYHEALSMWNSRYEWLPSRDDVPKEVGERIPDDHLKQLELKNLLRKSNSYLQILAVALEQVHKDMVHNEHSRPYAPRFLKFRYYLNEVRCEVQSAMYSLKMPREVLKGDVMDEKQRSSAETDRNIRDWIIFREYMNILEYVKDSCEYLLELKMGS